MRPILWGDQKHSSTLLIHSVLSLWIPVLKTPLSIKSLEWFSFHEGLASLLDRRHLKGLFDKDLLLYQKGKKQEHEGRRENGDSDWTWKERQESLERSLELGVPALCFLQDDEQHGSFLHAHADGHVEEQLHAPQLVTYGVDNSDVGGWGGNRAGKVGLSWFHLLICEEHRGQTR